MWFLLLQIFMLLVLAALCGAGLAWWWLRRRYEDVSESYELLRQKVSRLDKLDRLDELARRADVDVARNTLVTAVGSLQMPDLSPVEERLAKLEGAVDGIAIPDPDFAPLHQRLDMIEAHLLAPDHEAGEVRGRLEEVQGAVGSVAAAVATLRNVDLKPVEEQVGMIDLRLNDMQGKLEAARRTDIEVITARLATISSAVGGLRVPEMAPVEAKLADLRAAIGAIRIPELVQVEAELAGVKAAVAAIRIPEPNLAPVEARLGELARGVAALDKPPVDLGPLHGRLAAIEAELGAALQPFERRIASIQEALGSLPPPDMTTVISAVHQIDSREDLGAVEDRLTAIEYSLAALHHMMRVRPEASQVTRTTTSVRRASRETQQARPPRDLDPINAVRRVDDRANLLVEAAFGPPDDLKQINGVGPILSEMLNDLGIFYFWQVAEWTGEEVEWVDGLLEHFRGRIVRDRWTDHARTLAAMPGSARRPMGYEGRRENF